MKKVDKIVSTIVIIIGIVAILITAYILIKPQNMNMPEELNVYSNKTKVGIANVIRRDWNYNKPNDLVPTSPDADIFKVIKNCSKGEIKITKASGITISFENIPAVVKEKNISYKIYNSSGDEIKHETLKTSENQVAIAISDIDENSIYYVYFNISDKYGHCSYALNFSI